MTRAGLGPQARTLAGPPAPRATRPPGALRAGCGTATTSRRLPVTCPGPGQGQPPRAGPGPAGKRKAAQVWLFATRFDVPATNNGSENAVRGYKLAAKVSGCWRTLATLQRHCRIRSYLATARSHGRHPLAAIRDALNGNCWMPPHPA
jgi:hypothetical protein